MIDGTENGTQLPEDCANLLFNGRLGDARCETHLMVCISANYASMTCWMSLYAFDNIL